MSADVHEDSATNQNLDIDHPLKKKRKTKHPDMNIIQPELEGKSDSVEKHKDLLNVSSKIQSEYYVANDIRPNCLLFSMALKHFT